ncbi:MAG: hypothetical protein AAFX32_15265, partial [Pseudomonadota bacterium]
MKYSEFATLSELSDWLAKNHDQTNELWVRVFKKNAARATVSWQDCVVAAITWGWIDGHKKPLD